MAIDPINSNILYLATWNGVFKSINGGEGWFQVNNGLKTIIHLVVIFLNILSHVSSKQKQMREEK